MTAQIIQFPVQHSNGYNNLIQLFEICSSLESCNFYLESVEQLFRKGYISEKRCILFAGLAGENAWS